MKKLGLQFVLICSTKNRIFTGLVGLRGKQEQLMNFMKHTVIESIAKRNKTRSIVRTEHYSSYQLETVL